VVAAAACVAAAGAAYDTLRYKARNILIRIHSTTLRAFHMPGVIAAGFATV
jgi:hypothetical protein